MQSKLSTDAHILYRPQINERMVQEQDQEAKQAVHRGRLIQKQSSFWASLKLIETAALIFVTHIRSACRNFWASNKNWR